MPALRIVPSLATCLSLAAANRIEARATPLPLTLPPGQEAPLDLFYALSPTPQRVVAHDHEGQSRQRLELDTRQALHGLHLAQ